MPGSPIYDVQYKSLVDDCGMVAAVALHRYPSQLPLMGNIMFGASSVKKKTKNCKSPHMYDLHTH